MHDNVSNSVQQNIPTAEDEAASTPINKRSRPSGHKIGRNILRIMLMLLFLIGFVLSVLPWGRAIARSVLLLPALVAASQPAPLIANGETVVHKQMTVPSRGGTVYLDVYEPQADVPLIKSARSGVLIIPGAGDNRQVPQLINFSEALARTGLVVMDMVTPTLINYDLSVQDSDAVVQAFQKLSHLPEMAGSRIGIISFSAGVPLACFGAVDSRIRDQVAYIAVFGGYFNTKSVLRAFGRRAIDIDGKTESWQPTEVPILVLTNVITKAFSSGERSRIYNALAPGGIPLTSMQIAQLSPGARAAYQLLTGTAPDKVDVNIAALPPMIQTELDKLSPSRVITQIRAPIFLLHDRNDSSLPVTESRDFAAALTRLHHQHDYVEFHIFDHVQVRSNLQLNQELTDGIRLFTILKELLLTAS
jgi:dienelactone hydrolase